MIQFTWHCQQSLSLSHARTHTRTHTHTHTHTHDDGHVGSRGDQENNRKCYKRRGVCVNMSSCLCNERGAEWRQFLQERETIRGFMFTSQSTQTRVDPTAEEQSVREIKKEVRQHRVNIYPDHLITPLASGLTMYCGKCPHSLMPSQCPRCTDLWRTQQISKKHCSVSRSPTSGMSATSKETLYPVCVLIYIKLK